MRKVAVIGGDLRATEAAGVLLEHGCACVFFGNEGFPCSRCRGFDAVRCSEPYLLREALEAVDLILLPLPFSRDGQSVFAPFSRERISVKDFLFALPTGCTVVGGNLPALVTEKAGRSLDLLSDGEFALANALPTAESAIGLALLHYPDVLLGTRCGILGYGRIGGLLCEKLQKLGAQTEVFARREERREEARKSGAQAFSFDDLPARCGELKLVFNTVPHPVFTRRDALALPADALYFELASHPYGTTADARELLGDRLFPAGGLPGKYAPRYAGAQIARRVTAFLSPDEKEPERN